MISSKGATTIAAAAVLFIIITTAKADPMKNFEQFQEKHRPIRDMVCNGKASRTQLTAMVDCIQRFKASIVNRTKVMSVRQNAHSILSSL